MLPPPASRAQTMPNPLSPSNSRKESGGATSWWSAAKSRLTPTKDPLTPAQQIILDAKARDNDNKKNTKGKEKSGLQRPKSQFGNHNTKRIMMIDGICIIPTRDRKSRRLNSSHPLKSRMPSSA